MSFNNKRRKVDDPANTQPSLLQLPWSDFASAHTQPQSDSSTHYSAHGNTNDKNPRDSLLLLQLPPDLSLDTFLQATSSSGTNTHSDINEPSDVRIMIRDSHVESETYDATLSSSSSSTSSTVNPLCTMVLPQLGRTLALVRVETSNTYILVPPQSELPSSSMNPTASHVPMQARLLRERDTFMIEAMDISNQLSSTVQGKVQLQQYLKQFLFPVTQQGCTLGQLTQQFPFTEMEINKALIQIHAFTFPSASTPTTFTTFGWIQDEFFYLAIQAILYTLNEWNVLSSTDTHYSYATQGIHVSTFITQAIQHLNSLWIHVSLSTEQSYALIHHVLLHYMKQHGPSSTTSTVSSFKKEEEEEHWILNVEKIATFVAKILFLEQGTWKTNEFVEKWHSRIPGVGSEYQPDISILKGLCIVKQSSEEDGDDDEQTLLYFPQESLPTQFSDRFKKLFQLQSKWKWDDLEPYLAPMLDGWNVEENKRLDPKDPKVAALWMKYASVVVDDSGGGPGQSHVWYVAKKE